MARLTRVISGAVDTSGRDGPVLGIDVGGTTVKSALVEWHPTTGEPRLRDLRRVPTPRDDDQGSALTDVVAGLVDEYHSTGGVTALGLVVPGIVDDLGGRVVTAVNLGWRDVPLRDLVQDRVGVPVAFGHDVRAGALAEADHAARTIATAPEDPHATWAFVPVGTGIAAALVIAGRTVAAGGWAGEIGQVIVSPGDLRADILPRTLERVASAGAIARRAGAPDARTVADLVSAGDPHAASIWADAVDALAESLAWMTGAAGVSRIIMGGGLAESGELLLVPLRLAIAARLPGLRTPLVTGAALGDRAAIVGAAMLARASLEAEPHYRPAREDAA